MTDRETPLAEIVGQMSLSKYTDISTQSWVFISVNDDNVTSSSSSNHATSFISVNDDDVNN